MHIILKFFFKQVINLYLNCHWQVFKMVSANNPLCWSWPCSQGTARSCIYTGVKTLDSRLIIGHITGAIFGVKNGQEQQTSIASNITNLLHNTHFGYRLFKQPLTITLSGGLVMQTPARSTKSWGRSNWPVCRTKQHVNGGSACAFCVW